MTPGRSHPPKTLVCRLAPALAASLLVLAAFAFRAAAEPPQAVVELFTSQGCSSCPPADALLGHLARQPGIIALTLPVDYWDYLGWQDTFGSPAHSKRQEAYARSRGDGKVYTPQMVINGTAHVIGSHRKDVIEAIADEAGKANGRWVPVAIATGNGEVVVQTGGHQGTGEAPDATVWIALTMDKGEVAVENGENSGRKLTYFNVVRQLMPVGTWHGEPVTLRLPEADVMKGYDGCAVLLQENGTGPILGAAFMPYDAGDDD